MKVLLVGNLVRGSLSAYRADIMAAMPGVEVQAIPALVDDPIPVPSAIRTIAWKMRVPIDVMRLNRRILEVAESFAPDAMYCESVPFVNASTLVELRKKGVLIAGMSQDYVTARHNSNLWQDQALRHYDLFFTTKTFGVQELRSAGVRDVHLVNNTYERRVHRPMTPQEVGGEFDAFDCVFVGTYERERAQSLRKLAEAGLTVLVQGNGAGRIAGTWDELSHPNITRRPAADDIDYTRVMHRGKIGLGFLRKLNRDQITTRSIEIPAMGRAMLAERTDEHNAHFIENEEYLSFANDAEMVAQARRLIRDSELRASIGRRGRMRCERSRYDNDYLVERMLATMRGSLCLSEGLVSAAG